MESRQLTLRDLLGEPVLLYGLMDDAYCPKCRYGFPWWDTDQEECPMCYTRLDWTPWHRANDEEEEEE